MNITKTEYIHKQTHRKTKRETAARKRNTNTPPQEQTHRQTETKKHKDLNKPTQKPHGQIVPKHI